ncbi:LOW QUALITY PROTEIN: basic helix-loop-helix ARNT-like protein 2 [Rhynchonycteris naso]
MRSQGEARGEAHSQIEKWRRDKMNNLIEELSALIPQCNPLTKLDTLTVLRMVVQHLKSLKVMTNSYSGDIYRHSFMQDKELRHLILKTAEGFLFVVGCEGKILFVSKSVSKTLHYDQVSKTGHFPHYVNVSLGNKGACLQVHSNFSTGRACVSSGSRCSFFCQIKSCKILVKEELEQALTQLKEKRYQHFEVSGGGAQLGFDALCDSDDTAIAAFMNKLEAEGGLGDTKNFSDIHQIL